MTEVGFNNRVIKVKRTVTFKDSVTLTVKSQKDDKVSVAVANLVVADWQLVDPQLGEELMVVKRTAAVLVPFESLQADADVQQQPNLKRLRDGSLIVNHGYGVGFAKMQNAEPAQVEQRHSKQSKLNF